MCNRNFIVVFLLYLVLNCSAGRCLNDTQQIDSVEDFQKVTAMNLQAQDLLASGEDEQALRTVEIAGELCRKLKLEGEPLYAEILNTRGRVCEKLGRDEESDASYLAALKILVDFDEQLRPYFRTEKKVAIDDFSEPLRTKIQHLGGYSSAMTRIASAFFLQMCHESRAQRYRESTILRDTTLNAVLRMNEDVVRPNRAWFFYHIAGTYKSDNPVMARTLLKKTIYLAREGKDEDILADALSLDARIALGTLDYEDALKKAKEAEQLHNKQHNLKAIVDDFELLSELNEAVGDFEKAVFYSAAQVAVGKRLNDSHAICSALNSRASVCLAAKLYAEARSALEEASSIEQKDSNALEAPRVRTFELLGQLAELDGNDEKALVLYREAVGATEVPSLSALVKLANLELRKKNFDAASRCAEDISVHLEIEMARKIPSLLLSERLAFVAEKLPQITSVLVTCAQHIPEKRTHYYSELVRFKGSIQQLIAEDRVMLELAASKPQGVELSRERMLLQEKLVECSDNETEWLSLIAQKESLERIMIADELRIRGSRGELIDFPTLSRIRQRVEKDACLVDCYEYWDSVDGAFKYCVFVVNGDEDPVFVDLGAREEVNEKIARWFNCASRPLLRTRNASVPVERSDDYRDISDVRPRRDDNEESYRNALLDSMSKLRGLFRDYKRVYVVAEGKLSLLPWNALFGTNTTLISELNAPSELLRLSKWSALRKRAGSLLCVAGLDYAPSSVQVLPFSGDEIRECESFSKANSLGIQVLNERKATKSAVASAASHALVLHIATHGYFNELPPPTMRLSCEPSAYARARNPLLQEGLLLALPVIKSSAGTEPAHLSAQEITMLDLSKCDLVVLSACETGRGELIPCQGAFGLRTAFGAAGAQNILVSLWPVHDRATAELMREFYAALSKGLSPVESLSVAQEKMKMSTHWRDPYYWMGWTVVGRS